MTYAMILLVFLMGTVLKANISEHPNIIFILADDLGWKNVGFMCNRIIDTPNINKLASTGMVFTQGYIAAPTCTPTRASIMTGKYPNDLDMVAVIPSLKPNPEWDYGVPRGNILMHQYPEQVESLERSIERFLLH